VTWRGVLTIIVCNYRAVPMAHHALVAKYRETLDGKLAVLRDSLIKQYESAVADLVTHSIGHEEPCPNPKSGYLPIAAARISESEGEQERRPRQEAEAGPSPPEEKQHSDWLPPCSQAENLAIAVAAGGVREVVPEEGQVEHTHDDNDENAEGDSSGRGTKSELNDISITKTNQKYQRFTLMTMWHKSATQGHLRTISHGPSLHKQGSGFFIHKLPCVNRFDRALAPLMLDPSSSRKNFWGGFSIGLVCFDIIVIPLDSLVETLTDPFIVGMEWLCRVFWTVDILLAFLTGQFINGVVVMRPTLVARTYVTTWFSLDAFLVSSDWISVALGSGGAVSLIPLLRAVRLLRLLRLLRAARLKQTVEDLLLVAPDTIVLCAGVLKVTLFLFIVLHVVACFWYALGEQGSNGWSVSRFEDGDNSLAAKYSTSIHWTIALLHGASVVQPQSTLEIAVAAFLNFCGFVISSVFIGNMAYTVKILADPSAAQMQAILRRYMRTRKVSAKLQLRLNKFISARMMKKSFKDIIEHEKQIIAALPELIQQDLALECKVPLLSCSCFFRGLSEDNHRLISLIAFEVVDSVAYEKDDQIFLEGDTCVRMLVVESGAQCYTAQYEYDHGLSFTAENDVRFGQATKLGKFDEETGVRFREKHLERGQVISAPVLWVSKWVHLGDLEAYTDCTLLKVECEKFCATISLSEANLFRLTNYAKHYVAALNNTSKMKSLSDLVDLDIDFDTIDQVPEGNSDEHLLFISHFKREAGTEAALIEDALERMIHGDQDHPAHDMLSPAFLDSMDLADLSELRDRVKASHNLLLLLTPNVFSRPWCLVEIVTALWNNIPIVPVEIARPDMRFQYPDDAFLEGISCGKGLTNHDIDLLRAQGISLEEVTHAIRQVSLKISLPFSPHKAAKLRQAELEHILDRCKVRENVQQCAAS